MPYIGYVMPSSNWALDRTTAYRWAFSVVSVNCPHSLVHEVGHNIGAHHDRQTQNTVSTTNYNYGYCWDTSDITCSRSVMAYSGCTTTSEKTNCPRTLYFSSPNVTNGALGLTTGTETAGMYYVHLTTHTLITTLTITPYPYPNHNT
jgi:hypothetical protein